jgi:hypothetical protein
MDWLKKRDEEILKSDEYGDWVDIRDSLGISVVLKCVSDSLKGMKLKVERINVLSYTVDEKIKNNLVMKIVIICNSTVNSNALSSQFIAKAKKRRLELINLSSVNLKCCEKNFTFIKVDVIVRQPPKSRERVRVLVPPEGVNVSNIPMTLEQLLSSIVADEGRCHAQEAYLKDNVIHARLLCSKPNHLDRVELIQKKLEYFGNPGIDVKRNSTVNRDEVLVRINMVKRERLALTGQLVATLD